MPASPPDASAALQLRIDIEGFSPPIWRRVIVPTTFTFEDLHETIQALFEWEGYHLHEFKVGPERIGPDTEDAMMLYDDILGETKLRLVDVAHLVPGERDWFRYTYDFGDDWRHKVTVEEVMDQLPEQVLPVCVKGRKAAPREDSRFAETREEMVAGDPDTFDIDDIDARLEPIRAWWAKEGDQERAAQQPLVPPSDRLVWLFDDPGGCVVCQGELGAADLALDVETQRGLHPLALLEAWPCTACGTIHAWMDDLQDRLMEADIPVTEVHGFQVGDRTLDAYIGIPDVGGPTPSAERFTGVDDEVEERMGSVLVREGSGEPVGIPWRALREMEADEEQPPPPAAELVELPLEEAPWQVDSHPVAWVREPMAPAQLLYLLLVVDGQGLIRTSETTPDGALGPGGLAVILRRACVSPGQPLEPARPARVVLGEGLQGMAEELGSALSPMELEVAEGETPGVAEAVEAFGMQHDRGAPAWLCHEDAEVIEAFQEACEEMWDVEPWWSVEPDTFLAARVDGDRWFYVALMGQNGQDEGFMIFETWKEVEVFMQAAGDVVDAAAPGAPVDVAPSVLPGPVESVSMCPIEFLHPRDAHHLREHDLLDEMLGEEWLPIRFTAERAERPVVPLATYTRLIRAMNEALYDPPDEEELEVEVDGVVVELRVPATGEEGAT